MSTFISGAIDEKKIQEFFNVLEEPIQLTDKNDKMDSKMVRKLKKLAFLWKKYTAFHFNKFFISEKIQVLDFNLSSMIEKVDQFKNQEEIFIKRISIDWSPYISANLPGFTTLFLCDFRSCKWKNIIKGGYVWKTSEKVQGMTISPGYLVNLNDPNIDRVFRLICMNSGLDMIDGSFVGRLDLTVEFSISNSSINLKRVEDQKLTLVSNKSALALLQEGEGLSSMLTDKINVEDVIEGFKKNLGVSKKTPILMKDKFDLSSFIMKGAISEPARPSLSSLSVFQEQGLLNAEEKSKMLRSQSTKIPLKITESKSELGIFTSKTACGVDHLADFGLKKEEGSGSSKGKEKVGLEDCSKDHFIRLPEISDEIFESHLLE